MKSTPRLAHFVWPPTPLKGAIPAARQSRFAVFPEKTPRRECPQICVRKVSLHDFAFR